VASLPLLKIFSSFFKKPLTIRIMRVIIYIGGEKVTVREITKLLTQDGWELDRCRGSHKQYKHPTKKGIVTVPNHTGDLKIKTATSILKQAGLK
jgi:predicted RNA binding protein YcfA (HicA-like mRNA interferase family)